MSALTKEKFIRSCMKIIRPILNEKQVSGMGIAVQLGLLYDLSLWLDMPKFIENISFALKSCSTNEDVVSAFTDYVTHNNSIMISAVTEGVLS